MIRRWISGTTLFLASLSLCLASSVSEPDSVRDYIALREMMGNGSIRQGATFCEQLIDRYPNYISLYDAYAEISQYNGTLRDAVSFLDRRCDGSMRSAYSLYGLGCLQMRLKDYESAQDAFEHSNMFGLRDPRLIKGLAYSYGFAKGVVPAVTHFRVLCHRYPDRSDLWYALCLSYWGRNDHFNALSAARRALLLRPDEWHYTIAASVLPYAAGHHDVQEKTVVSLVDSARKRHDFETLGFLRSILVRAYIQDQRLLEAHDQTRLLLSEMSRVGDHKWMGWSYLSLSDVEFMEADFASSLENTKKAIESARKSGDNDLEWEAHNREFDCLMELGLFRKAIGNAQKRLSLQMGTGDQREAKALTDNARVFMEIGEYEVALEYGIRSIVCMEGNTTDPSVAAGIHSTLGQVYMGLGHYDEAMNQFATEEGIICGPLFSLRDKAVLRGNQGNCYMAEGAIDKAGLAFREQLGLVRKTRYSRERAYALLNLGNYYFALGDYWKAREEYLMALSEGRQLSVPRVVAQASHSLAALSERLGSEQETMDWLKIAISEWQKTNWLAKTGLLGTRGVSAINSDLERLLTLLIRSNRKEEAFNVNEIWNSGNGLPQLEQKDTDGRGALAMESSPVGSTRTNSRHEYRVDQAGQDLAMDPSGNHSMDELAHLASRGDDEDDEHGIASTLDPKSEIALSRSLEVVRKDGLSDGKTALLAFFFGERISYLFLATKDTLAIIELETNKSDLFSLVKRVASFIDASSVESAVVLGRPYYNRSIAESLSTILMRPARGILAHINRLFIVRGSDLGGLPFEMLPYSPALGELPKNSHSNFLLEQFEISYRYSAGLSRKGTVADRFDFPFLFAMGSDLADRSTSPQVLTSLLRTDSIKRPLHDLEPQINSELRWLRAEFGALALVLSDTGATKERLFRFAEGSAVIHIASHTRIRNGENVSASILLSSGNSNCLSDSLRVYDVLRMKTSAQLVVLSSCRTALQSEYYSKADYAKAFLIAGAGSVLASVWDADDACTEELMRSFYRHLRTGVRKSEALRSAKRELIDDGLENPYYWASFILIGDDAPICFPTDGTRKPWVLFTHSPLVFACVALGLFLVGLGTGVGARRSQLRR